MTTQTLFAVLDYEYRPDGSAHVVFRGLFKEGDLLPSPAPRAVRDAVPCPAAGQVVSVDVFRTEPPRPTETAASRQTESPGPLPTLAPEGDAHVQSHAA